MKKISRLISVIHRHGMRFFDWSLADTEIGPGQQFFLVCIYEKSGNQHAETGQDRTLR